MSKSELINSVSEDENNGTEESETSDDICLALQSRNRTCTNTVFRKIPLKKNCPGKEPPDSEEGTSKIGNTIWCFCGKYKPMTTNAESTCCLDKYEIRESYFKGITSFVFEIFLSSNQ